MARGNLADPAPRLLDLAERGRHPDVLKRVGDRAIGTLRSGERRHVRPVGRRCAHGRGADRGRPGLRRGGLRPAYRSGRALAPTPRRRHGAQSGSGDRQGRARRARRRGRRNRAVARCGSVRARMRDGFGIGMTILVALGNVLPELPDPERYLALFHGSDASPPTASARRHGANAPRSGHVRFARGAPPLVPAVDRGASPGRRGAHALDRDRAGRRACRARRHDAWRRDRPAFRRRRARAGLPQQSVRMHRSDRPGAGGRDPADRGRPTGRGARCRRAERLASPARPPRAAASAFEALPARGARG